MRPDLIVDLAAALRVAHYANLGATSTAWSRLTDAQKLPWLLRAAGKEDVAMATPPPPLPFCPQCRRPIHKGSLTVEVRKSGYGQFQQTVPAHHRCPKNFGVGHVSTEDDLPTGLDHEDVGRIYKLGYATYEWVGDFYVKYREDGLPTL